MRRGENFKDVPRVVLIETSRKGGKAANAKAERDPAYKALRLANLEKGRKGGGGTGRFAKMSKEELKEIGRKGGLATAAKADAYPEFRAVLLERLKKAREAITPEQQAAHGRKAALALSEKLGRKGNREKMKFAGAMKKFRQKGYLVEVPKEKK